MDEVVTYLAQDGATSQAQVRPPRAGQTIDWASQNWRIHEDVRNQLEEEESTDPSRMWQAICRRDTLPLDEGSLNNGLVLRGIQLNA